MTVKVFCDICGTEIASAVESRVNVIRKVGQKSLASWDVCPTCEPKFMRALLHIKEWIEYTDKKDQEHLA
jgi:hypothetical protein